MKLIGLYKSGRKDKRYVFDYIDEEGKRKKIHFGLYKGSTYIDHQDKLKRKNYLARHRVREDWEKINAGSLSARLLWGDSVDLELNLKQYLKDFDFEKTEYIIRV